jgi:hypothetical protein
MFFAYEILLHNKPIALRIVTCGSTGTNPGHAIFAAQVPNVRQIVDGLNQNGKPQRPRVDYSID